MHPGAMSIRMRMKRRKQNTQTYENSFGTCYRRSAAGLGDRFKR